MSLFLKGLMRQVTAPMSFSLKKYSHKAEAFPMLFPVFCLETWESFRHLQLPLPLSYNSSNIMFFFLGSC